MGSSEVTERNAFDFIGVSQCPPENPIPEKIEKCDNVYFLRYSLNNMYSGSNGLLRGYKRQITNEGPEIDDEIRHYPSNFTLSVLGDGKIISYRISRLYDDLNTQYDNPVNYEITQDALEYLQKNLPQSFETVRQFLEEKSIGVKYHNRKIDPILSEGIPVKK